MDWKVGDKFTLNQQAVDYFSPRNGNTDCNGKTITLDTIFEVVEIKSTQSLAFNLRFGGAPTIVDVFSRYCIKVEEQSPKIGDKFKLNKAGWDSVKNWTKGITLNDKELTEDTVYTISQIVADTFLCRGHL